MHEHRGEYGYDGSFQTVSAGTQLAVVGASSTALLVAAGVCLARGRRLAAALAAASAVEMAGTAAWCIYATRSGKFRVWDGVLDDLRLRGDETLLDLGCVRTADMTALPLADESVDAVVSSLAIHNIPTPAGRRQALDEAVRVLRPGGRLAIADMWETRQHAARLRELGWRNVKRRNLGWRMWYGGPWFPTRLVTVTKAA
jgi:arsenite methyltransferase